MATPGRSRPVRQSSDAAALQARLATMTYSFAQQMPALPPRPSQPPPRPASSDPNFPHLPHTPSPHPTQQPWVSPPGKPTTAAEIVAAKKPDVVPNDQRTHENEKQQAELALYSKLVPTTSAVPRNPGRSLGGGGLRATGSVAAQKSRVVIPPTQTSLVQRKEPLASRMRSLSSEASRPQLARKVAKPNRAMSATPPPVEKDSGLELNNASNASEEYVHNELVESGPPQPGSLWGQVAPEATRLTINESTTITAPKPREVQKDSRDAYLKSIVSIYGHLDKETPRPGSRSESTGLLRRRSGGEARQTGGEPISVRRQKNSQIQTRRLEEAFANGGRYDGVRSPSPVAMRKSQIGALRRPSAASPPPTTSVSRKTGVREQPVSKEKHGSRGPVQESTSDAPPGFEGRAATASRAAFVSRRADVDVANGPKPNERENVPALPQNDRADAFREAISTRRHSSSPRPSSFRRIAGNDSHQDGSQQTTALRVPEKENSRHSSGSKGQTRPGSFPSKPNGTLGSVSSEEIVRSKRRTDHGNSKVKRDEKIFERLLERPGDAQHYSQSDLVSQRLSSADENGSSRLTSSTHCLINGVKRIAVVEDVNLSSDLHDISHLMPGGLANHDVGLNPVMGRLSRQSINGSGEKLNRSSSEPVRAEKTDFVGQRMNGWPMQENGVHCGSSESLVNGLLDEEDEYVPAISAGLESRSVSTASAPGTSMIELMRQLQASASLSSVLNSDRCEDVVLPPLPDPEEDVRFESMLRSMGWTPPDEDESSRGNGMGMIRETTSRALQAGVGEISGEIGMNGGIRSVKNGKGQSPYYSHFQ